MGDEVRDPERTIPHAIQVARAVTVAIYATVAVAVLAAIGATSVAATAAPLAAAVGAGSWGWAVPVVQIGGAAAALGALLALLAGVGRTSLAMARHQDLPSWLAAVHPRFKVPHHAEVALAAVTCLLVLTVDLRGAIGFASFGVLLYYFVANVAAFTQAEGYRRFPRWLQVVGAGRMPATGGNAASGLGARRSDAVRRRSRLPVVATAPGLPTVRHRPTSPPRLEATVDDERSSKGHTR